MERSKAREIMNDVEAALKVALAKHGLAFYAEGKFRFSQMDDNFTWKIGARKVQVVQGTPLKAEPGMVFGSRTREFMVTGIVPSRPAYPVSATNLRTGKKFKFPTAAVNPGTFIRRGDLKEAEAATKRRAGLSDFGVDLGFEAGAED